MIRVACIGSREISPWAEGMMEKIGEILVLNGAYIATGNALGSDAAYARGANRIDPTHVIIYLPWKTYNKEFLVEGNRITWDENPEWEFVARAHHPVFDQLKKGARSMMIRNAGILSKANACIAFLNHAKEGGGGTGHGWRISNTMGIPRFDISQLNPCDRRSSRTFDEFLKTVLTPTNNDI